MNNAHTRTHLGITRFIGFDILTVVFIFGTLLQNFFGIIVAIMFVIYISQIFLFIFILSVNRTKKDFFFLLPFYPYGFSIERKLF